MNDDITFFPLALPVAIRSEGGDQSIGIASFYIEYGDACYVYLYGHGTKNHYLSNPEILLTHSVLQNQNIEKTRVYRIIYDEFFNTSNGFFLKRPSIGNVLKDLQNTSIPRSLVTDLQKPSISIGKPKLGSAQLLTTIDGFEPRLYSCVINKIFDDGIEDISDTDYIAFLQTSFRLCINDMNLINAVGGSCAGMSGSVIIQNNTIVGVLSKGHSVYSNYGLAVGMDQIVETLSTIHKNESFKQK